MRVKGGVGVGRRRWEGHGTYICSWVGGVKLSEWQTLLQSHF